MYAEGLAVDTLRRVDRYIDLNFGSLSLGMLFVLAAGTLRHDDLYTTDILFITVNWVPRV